MKATVGGNPSPLRKNTPFWGAVVSMMLGVFALVTAEFLPISLLTPMAAALSITVSGVAAPTLVAGPVGSYVGDIMGWRDVFMGAAGLGLIALLVPFATLPSLPPRGQTSLRTLMHVLQRPRVKTGLIAAMLVFIGHVALFTYVRPFLESSTSIAITTISTILLVFGLANYVGTWLGGMLQQRRSRATMICAPLVMALAGFGLNYLSATPVVTAIFVIFWGLAFGTVPGTWSHWVAHTIPDEAESAGGLLVAAINAAIASGAGVGGLILDYGDIADVFNFGSCVLIAATLLISMRLKPASLDVFHAGGQAPLGTAVCASAR